MVAVHHDHRAESRERFLRAGYRASHVFPHRVRRLPKVGPDGFKIAKWMAGASDPNQLWQIVLHASESSLEGLPESLFFDPDLVWHQQHFNRPGQIAAVDLMARGRTLITAVHQSDLVQRMSRRREFKTRVENTFRGWHHLLLNAVAGFAADRGFREIRVPSSELAMEHTDKSRPVQPDLFERVYDRAVAHCFTAVRSGQWWSIDVAANRARLVTPERRTERLDQGPTVCLCHDIERGLGHRGIDDGFARRADADAPAALQRMLEVERSVGVRATYSVVGCFLEEVRSSIERDRHCLAFHSYDHEYDHEQLPACRRVDYRIKGYRAPQSRLTPELSGSQLQWHNFEWLASSATAFGFGLPRLEHRLVKIPIELDDFPMHEGRLTFEQWRAKLFDALRQTGFVAFGLHDCYAQHWLPHYEQLLTDLGAKARFRTLDEVAADMYLAAAV
jgi:hypothetical protein